MKAPVIESLLVEHRRDAGGAAGVGIGTATPRLSWTVFGGTGGQSAYQIKVTRDESATRVGHWIHSSRSLLVAWPGPPLRSRERAVVQVRVQNMSGQVSSWSSSVTIEAALLHRSDWTVPFVSPSLSTDSSGARPAYMLRAEFDMPAGIAAARLRATAHGVYELELNGTAVGSDLLAPGWTSYLHRLRQQTYAIDELVRPGRNAVGVWLADGWYRGRLGFHGGLWDNYGTDVAVLLQLELTSVEGSVHVVDLSDSWTWSLGPITSTGLYEGETYDARLYPQGWSEPGFDDSAWHRPTALALHDFPAAIEAPTGPPIRVTQLLKPQTVQRIPNGRVRLDLGQNISGRLSFALSAEEGRTITLHHAEVLEHGQLATRPLRTAKSVDTYTFRGSGVEKWSPRFTFHGFRYAEIENWAGELSDLDVHAEVLHSDMQRTGWFTSSHVLLNQLHENTVWGMRGNFVDLPTDCPQRDERLGWTGDMQVFAPAAAFLYACTGTVTGWLRDLAAEQQAMGSVPNFVPWIDCGFPTDPAAAWGDAAVIVPWVLYERTGDTEVLRTQLPSMKAWVEQVDALVDQDGLWNSGFQLGDWLDPAAPPDSPGDSLTDRYLVSSAYFIRSSALLSRACAVLGDEQGQAHYEGMSHRSKAAFQAEYLSATGRVVSDTPTAIALALVFDLLPGLEHRERAGRRLVELVLAGDHRIQTGFVGTPIICDALVQAGAVETAYHLLLQEDFPSWLYPVTLGATTIWERWDSMLPNGDVNEGEMTSFNHYALGAVVDFLHRVVAGLAPATPGYAEILVAPMPGGGLTHASARHITPFGVAEVGWRREGGTLQVDVTVPEGARAHVRLPGVSPDQTVSAGFHQFETTFPAPENDAPRPVKWRPHAD